MLLATFLIVLFMVFYQYLKWDVGGTKASRGEPWCNYDKMMCTIFTSGFVFFVYIMMLLCRRM